MASGIIGIKNHRKPTWEGMSGRDEWEDCERLEEADIVSRASLSRQMHRSEKTF